MPDSEPTVNTRISEALKHLDQGFSAFSVWSTHPDGMCRCPLGAGCASSGKHPIPKDGFLAASRDPAVVTTMLSAGSEPNYGLVWPVGDDIVIVLDVDGADWKARIEGLKATYGPLPPTKTTRTPSGGLHLFYRWPVGVPIPDGNTLHGFVVRFPMKGYVVGPGSQINGKVYRSVSGEDIAILPREWATSSDSDGSNPNQPLIRVVEPIPAYKLPESVESGSRHDEVTRFVAHLWNKRLNPAQIAVLVESDLRPLFKEPVSDQKLARDIDEAIKGAEKKWEPSFGGESTTATGAVASSRDVMEVGLLPANAPVTPEPMRPEAYSTAVQVALLMDHFKPRTDASFEGLTITSLTYLGALMGSTPSCFYGSREQHANIFSMLVGTTGLSRKGTTVSLVRGALGQATESVRGLKQSPNSGEGLIALAAKAEGAPILVEEEEFERFLVAKGREGSTLSSILRQAFDDIPLTSATAQRIVRSDVHHIAMLANVTREEVVDSMARVDLKNGFANRILWTGVFQRQGQVTVNDNALDANLRDALRDALRWTGALVKPFLGGPTHQISDPARGLLSDAAARYNAGVGMAPFLSRRLDTIAARISLIYACLDESKVIDVIHVEAAIAITDYAYATARWVFPETTGDTDADLVLRHLRIAGFLNAVELEALVGKRPKDKQRVADLLDLMGYARIAERPRKDGKGGRPQRGLELIR